MKRLSKQRGFTLVELLVVIAIIGILIGMLLPAVQQVREAARRTQCLNNVRQMALASLNYESAHMEFPTAGTQLDGHWQNARGDNDNYGAESASWGFQLLPYIEQQNLANIRTEFAWGNPTPSGQILESEHVPTYVCPSRGPRTWGDLSGSIWACADYSSAGRPYVTWTPGGTRISEAQRSGQNPGQFANANGYQGTSNGAEGSNQMWQGIIVKGGHWNRNDGVFNRYGGSGFGEISDGSSNVVMYMEKSASTLGYSGVHDPAWQIIGEVYGQYVSSNHTNNRFNRPLQADSPRVPNNSNRALNEQGFGSPHPGTVTACLGDGSAHNISLDIQWELLWDISMRADGQIVDHSEL